MRDAATATMIERIGEIKASTPTPPTVAACERPASDTNELGVFLSAAPRMSLAGC
jgi:hypothetical protein